MADADWSDWMVAAQRGDAAAYRRLLAELERWLRGYYGRRLPPGTVDDAIQDTLLAIHEKRHTFEPGRPLGPWVAAIARYKWIDRLRSMSAHRTEELLDGTDPALSVADHGDAVGAGVVLERLLARLKPAQARVVRLVKLRGLSIEEASRLTGQSAALVKVNIHRGLRRMGAMAQGSSDDE
ncbi:sigma-70 family RNA polymerase sigma factor [Rhizosaccharibacter radicis]|uniref:Sigma-70 family RNA polymerase sigma factor n=1 Tax=Rhizosaccharibacter radicis TaxID=2782605 RepID=A0ABT1VTS8_9PROT|nr:sigma-70 family RNA polymerase sigma factor [Acetobacteraceae bacterium KSS12]